MQTLDADAPQEFADVLARPLRCASLGHGAHHAAQ
jgi:hypothetical protein